MAATAKAMDFTNVTDGGQFQPRRVPAGDYRAKITAVEDHTSKDSNVPNNWVFTIVLTSRARNTYPYYCGFDVKQAWKVRGLCMAAGLNVPKKRVKVDPNKLVGKEIGVAMEDDEYDGKTKSVIAGVFPVSELSEDYPGAGSGGKSSSRSSASNDDVDDDADDDVSDGDADELDLEEI
jgi:hypothetical protein